MSQQQVRRIEAVERALAIETEEMPPRDPNETLPEWMCELIWLLRTMTLEDLVGGSREQAA